MDDTSIVGIPEALGELRRQDEDRVDVAATLEVQQRGLACGAAFPPAATNELDQPLGRVRGRPVRRNSGTTSANVVTPK